MKETHVLTTRNGFKATLTLDTGKPGFTCEWTPHMPRTKEQLDKAGADYLPWRDRIVNEWANNTGQRILIATPMPGGALLTKCGGRKV
jgi:hypothetical protein